MRIHDDIGRTIARTRGAFPVSRALALGLVLTSGACRGGCARVVDPAATASGRLALLPEPTRVLVSIDVAKLRASAVAGQLGALSKQSPEDAQKLEDFTRRTGFDPLAQLDSVLVGFPEDARQRGELALVVRAQRFDGPRLIAYARDQLHKKGDDLVATTHGRFTLWAAGGKPDVAGFFVDERTFVLGAGGWAPRLADLAQNARPGDSAATNIDLARLVARAGEHALWAAAIVPAETRRALAADPRFGSAATLADLVVGIDLPSGLDAVVVGDVATSGDAELLVAKMQETVRDAKRNASILMLGLGPYLDGVTARAVDRRFELRATLSEPQVADLVGRLGAFLALSREGGAPAFK
jgi:hypothetical protein